MQGSYLARTLMLRSLPLFFLKQIILDEISGEIKNEEKLTDSGENVEAVNNNIGNPIVEEFRNTE